MKVTMLVGAAVQSTVQRSVWIVLSKVCVLARAIVRARLSRALRAQERVHFVFS